MAKPKSRGRGTFPWEYDAMVEVERKAGKLKRSRTRAKAILKLEKQRDRARRIRDDRNKPLDSGIPKMIRPWPQGWRVPTTRLPLTEKEYAKYLETPHWQEFRDKYRSSDLLQECYVCGNTEFELHHHTYVRLGNEGLTDVIPLCRVHHSAVHKAVKSGIKLSNAHSWVKARFQSGQLEMKVTKLEN